MQNPTIDLAALAAALAAVQAHGVSLATLLAYSDARNIVAVAEEFDGDGAGVDGHFSMWSQATLEDARDETTDHINAVGDVLTAMGY